MTTVYKVTENNLGFAFIGWQLISNVPNLTRYGDDTIQVWWAAFQQVSVWK